MNLTEEQLNLLLSGLYAERQQLHDRMKKIDELSQKLSEELDKQYNLDLCITNDDGSLSLNLDALDLL